MCTTIDERKGKKEWKPYSFDRVFYPGRKGGQEDVRQRCLCLVSCSFMRLLRLPIIAWNTCSFQSNL